MGSWETIISAALVLLIIYLSRPGLRAAMEKSRQAQNADWRSLLTPLILLVLFVMLLIVIAQSTSEKRNPPTDDLLKTRSTASAASSYRM